MKMILLIVVVAGFIRGWMEYAKAPKSQNNKANDDFHFFGMFGDK